VFITRFKLTTRCQMMTPLLNCACMLTWSGVTHSVDNRWILYLLYWQ